MASQRKDIIAPGYIYHVFNRSVERRPVFTNKYEYQRMLDILWFYRFTKLPMRYSQLVSLSKEAQNALRDTLRKQKEKEIAVYAFALMPNHFHLLLRGETPKGISVYLSNISNSYAKYFNVSHKRTGSLWQRPFKAVRIETEEQFLHVSRYIHINPASFVIKEESLDSYPWTSLPEYLSNHADGICETSTIRGYFKTTTAYRSFIHDQINYAKTLEKIKHLSIDGEEEWV